MAKRPLPPVPDDPPSQLPTPSNNSSPSPKTNRYASRALPPPPPVPPSLSTSQVTDSRPEVIEAKPKPPRPPAVKPAANDISINNTNNNNNTVDLAAILKAKFEKRARSDSSSQKDDETDSTPMKQVLPTGKALSPPSLPSKPSALNKPTKEISPKLDNVDLVFPKPPPPVKSKPKPSPIPDKSSSPFVALKPVSSNNSNSCSINKASDSKIFASSQYSDSTEAKPSVKDMAGMFGKSNISKPSTPNKPIVATKPKPSLALKPTVSSKPSPATKPSPFPKPLPASKPTSSSKPLPDSKPIGSLISSLNNKLNLNNPPPSIDVNQNESKASGGWLDSTSSPEYVMSDPMSSIDSNNPSEPSETRSCIALYDFAAEHEGEISFNEGDDLEIIEEAGDWTLVKFYDEEGWAPANYLSKS